MTDIETVRAELKKMADAEYAKTAARFFKTGKGEYGEGDIFIGIRVPALRKAAQRFSDLPLDDIGILSLSDIHEERMIALLLLVHSFKRAKRETAAQKKIFDWYMAHTAGINNWDLVDLSAPEIPGAWLLDRDRSVLLTFAKDRDLWKRRIAIVATHAFIKKNDFLTTFEIADILMNDTHDLIHKAVGWMLREAGKRDLSAEKDYLKTRYKTMPRTMLRYAIERFPEAERKRYLEGRI